MQQFGLGTTDTVLERLTQGRKGQCQDKTVVPSACEALCHIRMTFNEAYQKAHTQLIESELPKSKFYVGPMGPAAWQDPHSHCPE